MDSILMDSLRKLPQHKDNHKAILPNAKQAELNINEMILLHQRQFDLLDIVKAVGVYYDLTTEERRSLGQLIFNVNYWINLYRKDYWTICNTYTLPYFGA